jgi:hypothetical protein
VLFGPYIPVPPGSWIASFDLAAADASQHSPAAHVATLEVTHREGVRLAARTISAGELARDRHWSRHDVSFTLEETIMGVEFRVLSEGPVDLLARASVDLQPAGPIELPQLPSLPRRVTGRLSRLLAR